MRNWRSFLWRRWINRLADSAVSGRRLRRRSVRDGSFSLERLEDRLVPAVVGIAADEVALQLSDTSHVATLPPDLTEYTVSSDAEHTLLKKSPGEAEFTPLISLIGTLGGW